MCGLNLERTLEKQRRMVGVVTRSTTAKRVITPYHFAEGKKVAIFSAHLDEQFLQVSRLGFVTLGPFHCA